MGGLPWDSVDDFQRGGVDFQFRGLTEKPYPNEYSPRPFAADDHPLDTLEHAIDHATESPASKPWVQIDRFATVNDLIYLFQIGKELSLIRGQEYLGHAVGSQRGIPFGLASTDEDVTWK